MKSLERMIVEKLATGKLSFVQQPDKLFRVLYTDSQGYGYAGVGMTPFQAMNKLVEQDRD